MIVDNDYDGGSFGANGFQIMSMMSALSNSLKTGDPTVDMVMAMMIPFLLKLAFDWLAKMQETIDWETIHLWLFGSEAVKEEHERFISHSTIRGSWGHVCSTDPEKENGILLKAIKLYLSKVVQLKMNRAHLDLMDTCDRDFDDDDDYEEWESKRRTLAGTLSFYKVVKEAPVDKWHDLGEYGETPETVRMMIERDGSSEEVKDGNSSSSKSIDKTTLHFVSEGEDAIEDFVEKAFNWYLDELKKLEDHSRFYYEMNQKLRIGGDDDESDTSSCTYKRYKLSDEKTFGSLFFREKDNLLRMVDNFMTKSGKYAIRGYPHKLGLLLHGPPGTGKTSLIKAIAQYTGRSIVNVPLSKISTNNELMSIFFGRKYKVEGEYMRVSLRFEDVIFVMEDVDCASEVVKRRDGKTGSSVSQRIDLPAPKSLWQLFVESSDSKSKELVERLMEELSRLKEEALKPRVLEAVNQRAVGLPALGLVGAEGGNRLISRVSEDAIDAYKEQEGRLEKLDEVLSKHAESIIDLLDLGIPVDDKFVEDLLGETCSFANSTVVTCSSSSSLDSTSATDSFSDVGASNSKTTPMGSPPRVSSNDAEKKKVKPAIDSPLNWGRFDPDALSLAGLLNVLDGVVDCPGRIVILTSNHPELLDPALIRPGRVDKKLLLGYMVAEDVVSMLAHYFQGELTSEQVSRVKDLVTNQDVSGKPLKLTPAEVEQMVAECNSIDEVLNIIQERVLGINLR